MGHVIGQAAAPCGCCIRPGTGHTIDGHHPSRDTVHPIQAGSIAVASSPTMARMRFPTRDDIGTFIGSLAAFWLLFAVGAFLVAVVWIIGLLR